MSLPPGTTIKLRFLEFQLEDHPSCDNDFIEVYSGQAKARTKIGRYCGQRFPAFIESSSNVMEITFVSNDKGTRSGLKLHYTSRKGKMSNKWVCFSELVRLVNHIGKIGFFRQVWLLQLLGLLRLPTSLSAYSLRTKSGRVVSISFYLYFRKWINKQEYKYELQNN